jgi:hypothetical protein
VRAWIVPARISRESGSMVVNLLQFQFWQLAREIKKYELQFTVLAVKGEFKKSESALGVGG